MKTLNVPVQQRPMSGATPEQAPLGTGEYVNTDHVVQSASDTDRVATVWRAHASADGGAAATMGCGRLDPCPTDPAVGPGSVVFALIGLAGLIAFRRSRFHPDNYN